MKIFLKIFGFLIGTFLLAVVLLYVFNFEYILRGAKITYLKGYKTAYIDDYPNFDNRKIATGETHQKWPKSTNYNKTPPSRELKKINEDLKTAAFLIIKNDSIWYEAYDEKYGADSKTNSFSMAKSIVSAMLGKAIQEGYIKDLSQSVSEFYPQFDPSLQVGDLASMASGLNWDEDYFNPFSMTARAYFDEDIRSPVLDLEVIKKPGEEFEYLSGNTQLLAMVLEKSTGKSLSEYLSESFWKPLGTRNNALWQLDSEQSGMEKAYCCIASNARDFARFGKLYKDSGNWQGVQILDSAFVERSIRPRFEESPQYGYGFWLSNYRNKNIFYMRGVLGQYVIVIPEDDLIIVRLGKKLIKRDEKEDHSPDFFMYIDETYKMLKNASQTAAGKHSLSGY